MLQVQLHGGYQPDCAGMLETAAGCAGEEASSLQNCAETGKCLQIAWRRLLTWRDLHLPPPCST